MATGLFADSLVLDNQEFNSFKLGGSIKVQLLNTYTFTTASVDEKYIIPLYQADNSYIIILNSTSDSNFTSYVNMPIELDIASDGSVIVNPIGSYTIYEYSL